jgi:hypothetical protein
MALGAPDSVVLRIGKALDAGRDRDDVVRDLIASGLSAGTAERFVDRALLQRSQQAQTASPGPHAEGGSDRRAGLIAGSVGLSLGGTVTGATYLLAAPGEQYTVAYGALIVGLAVFVRGMKAWLHSSQPFPWAGFLVAAIVPPIGATAILVGSVGLREGRRATRRAAEETRVAAARAIQEEARVVAERRKADAARAERHAQRVAHARSRLTTSRHAVTLCEAALDLGHAKANEAIPDLAAVLADAMQPASVRGCAASALAELGETERALAFYTECARAGTSELREVARSGFGTIGPPAADVALPFLTEEMTSPNVRVRVTAVVALSKLGAVAAPALQGATRDPDATVRDFATRGLRELAE